MATDKSLPDSDDDIIDLTDLVEEGTAGDGASGDTGVDMSFEQELDDLFGDAEPLPAKAAQPAKESQDADDLFDLAGFEANDAPKATDAPDDDVIDLAGLGLDEEPETAQPGGNLADLGFDDDLAPAAAKAGDADTLDISDVGIDDLGLDETPKTQAVAPPPSAPDFGDLEEKPADAAATAPATDTMDLASLDFDDIEPAGQDAAADIAAMLTEQDDSPAQDLSDADLDALLAEPDQTSNDAAMADLLGALPDAPEDATPSPADLTGEGQTPIPAVAEAAGLAAAAAVPLAAMAAVGTARSEAGPSVGGIDLGALDTLIDSSKAPAAEAQAPAAPDSALLDRVTALETAAADLGQRLDGLPPIPSEETLAETLAARLESLLTSHLDALRGELPAAGDLARADDVTSALTDVRQSLARLEALDQGRRLQFEDFTRSMETQIAELRRELPAATDFVSPERLAQALGELRETLAGDLSANLAARLDAAVDAARQAAHEEIATLGRALTERIDNLENDRIDPNALAANLRETLLSEALDPKALQDAAATAAKADAAAQQALAGLETRLTPGDLDAALKTLRTELVAEMERAVPQAAATVIREEIAGLLHDLGE
ncbi:MAG: hypothetical protein ACLGQH_13800 [Acidobacteriota bacterium]